MDESFRGIIIADLLESLELAGGREQVESIEHIALAMCSCLDPDDIKGLDYIKQYRKFLPELRSIMGYKIRSDTTTTSPTGKHAVEQLKQWEKLSRTKKAPRLLPKNFKSTGRKHWNISIWKR